MVNATNTVKLTAAQKKMLEAVKVAAAGGEVNLSNRAGSAYIKTLSDGVTGLAITLGFVRTMEALQTAGLVRRHTVQFDGGVYLPA